jgi:hypothetical protein
MRATIDMHCSNDGGSSLRNKLFPILVSGGFSPTQIVGLYETDNISESQLTSVLNSFWQMASNHVGPGKISKCLIDASA